MDRTRTNRRLLSLYDEVVREQSRARRTTSLKPALARIVTEGQIIADKAGAFIRAVTGGSAAASVSAAEATAAMAVEGSASAGLAPAAPS